MNTAEVTCKKCDEVITDEKEIYKTERICSSCIQRSLCTSEDDSKCERCIFFKLYHELYEAELEDEANARICGECDEMFDIEYPEFYEYWNEKDNICYCSEDCYNKWKESDGWEWSYACDETKCKSFVMSGGSSKWWNYVVIFDSNGEQTEVFAENKRGKVLMSDKRLIINDGDDEKRGRVKLVDKSYEPTEDEEFVTYY